MALEDKRSEAFVSGKRIIVSGAGIAGLAFVVSLKALWREEMGTFPEIVHYEREHGRPDMTREGYSISIRSGGTSMGMQALQQMHLLEKVCAAGFVREVDEAAYHGLWSMAWKKLVPTQLPALPGLPRSPMRITRTALRMILLEACGQKQQMHWGVACTSIISTDHGRIRVTLSDGREDLCDILVAADGATSKLRASLRPSDRLDFAGPVSISAISRFQGPPPIPVNKAWGLIPSGTGVSLFVSPMSAESAYWCLSYIAESPRNETRQPIAVELGNSLLEEARTRGAIFSEPFPTLVDHSDPTTLMLNNAMDKKPFSHGISNGVPDGVCFIGDSNHAVSAFAANGANLSLIDGFDLAECLCTEPSIGEAMVEYDTRSRPRAALTLTQSRHHIAVVHSKGLGWLYHRCLLLLHGARSEVSQIVNNVLHLT